MLFGLRTSVGPGNHVLDRSLDFPMGRGNFEGRKGRLIVKYRDTLRSSVQKTAESIEMPFGLWPRTDESCVRWECRGAKGRCHGNHVWLSTGYNFGCVIASNILFDSRGGFLG